MRTRRSRTILNAQKFMSQLLYEASGGRIGKPVEGKEGIGDKIEWKDKRALLDTMLKMYQLEEKLKPEDEESGLGLARGLLHETGGGNVVGTN